MSVAPPFAALPPELSRLLLVGGRGPGLVPARDAALAAGSAWGGLTEALALAVWEDAPLCPETATFLAGRQAARPFLEPGLARLVEAVAASGREGGPEPYYDRLAARRDVPRLVAYLLEKLRRFPGDAGLANRLATVAPMAADAGVLVEAGAVLANLEAPLELFGLLAAGELALLGGDALAAERAFRLVLGRLPLASVRLSLAEALWRQGGRDEAMVEQTMACRARPFDTLALGRLADWATGLADRRLVLPGSVAVLLYSYNNAFLLDATLASLAATDWSQAGDADGSRLFVLDNGSTDDTGAVLAGWRDRLGQRLRTIGLPVNIGAPAARNWLAALPEVRGADFVAYLDDDATVPSDWLGRFGAAVASAPAAGVWGTMVRGTGAPHFVQSADTHLLPTPRQDGFGRAFEMARPWLATADWGRYAVCRPCASVTGCCHLFRTDILADLGGFDIRYSPSQYDDVDHDLRLLLSGRVPVCQAHLTVRHAKLTGAAGAPGGAQYGSGFANQFKLHHKYDDAAIGRAATAAFDALAEDLATKRRQVAALGIDLDGEGDGDG